MDLSNGPTIERVRVTHGDCLDVMQTMHSDSVDSIVTDPPYGLSFMGKGWDHAVPGVEFWQEALRVAKPGAHLVAFGGTRTFHRLAVAIEDAGWEVRDCLSWLYGSGFPKSHNGPWGGTALKPAWEPIIMARKPLIGTVAANVSGHGTGGLNIDGCRIDTDDALGRRQGTMPQPMDWGNRSGEGVFVSEGSPLGRWPANVVLDEEAGAMLDEQSGVSKGSGPRVSVRGGHKFGGDKGRNDTLPGRWHGDTGGASRFFYCAKASRAEREAGLDGMEERVVARSNGAQAAAGRGEEPGAAQVGLNNTHRAANHHPTVKPIALMRWLCRLVTPAGGLVLDPFMGSGTTGCAAVAEGFRFHGVELNADYAEIARRRIEHHVPELALGVS